ncbi:unnamed protein product [Effrenium voratum]|uniref:Nucleotide-diphospho-sugar transferase domain-containing protein n=1 Tax=Effrenium voratum TaxID=2562239 RepID=A0AA36J9J6_9DINO|nr:unnamed protein product [Effrenium voratum]
MPVREDILDDLKGNNRAGGGMPTYLYKSAKIRKALDEVEDGEVFLFTDVDVQYFQPVKGIVEERMASGVDMIFQKEFEDIGVNIGWMALRNTGPCRAFWDHVYGEISRTQALDQRVVNNSLYSGHAASLGLRWDRWPSSIWASSLAFSGPLPELVVHHANFLVEKAPSANPAPKLSQLRQLRDLQAAKKAKAPEAAAAGSDGDWEAFMAAARSCQAMLDYRSRHFGSRRPGPEWSLLPEGHVARPGGFSERAAKKAAAALPPEPAKSAES